MMPLPCSCRYYGQAFWEIGQYDADYIHNVLHHVKRSSTTIEELRTGLRMQYRLHLPKSQQQDFVNREKEQELLSRFKQRIHALGR